MTGFCAVPPNTPINRNLRLIASAGAYYVTSYSPKQGVVLARNPNYHGSRPRHFARIELSVRIPASRAVHMIETGNADFTTLGGDFYPSTPTIKDLATQLAARYGAGSDKRQYFVNPTLSLDYFALNTHRRLFSDVRLRQAVNYAIDRDALAELGTPSFQPLPEPPTDQYLPPGMPGYRAGRIYPDRPDPAKARQLVESAHASGRTAVLYTAENPPGPQMAQIVKNNLGAIGIHVDIHAFPTGTLFSRLAQPGEPFDISYAGWSADHPDPSQMLNWLLDGSAGIPSLNDAGLPAPTRSRLAALRPAAIPRIRRPRPGPHPQRRAARRLRQHLKPRPLLRTDRLPNLRHLRREPSCTLYQAFPPLMIGRPGCQTAAGGARATLDSGHQEPRYFTHGAAIAAEWARRARLEFAAEARVRQPDATHVTSVSGDRL